MMMKYDLKDFYKGKGNTIVLISLLRINILILIQIELVMLIVHIEIDGLKEII